MEDREKYLESLKKELDAYTKQLSLIQGDFKGRTGKHVKKINKSLQDVLQEAAIAYRKLKSASTEEWEPLKAITVKSFNDLRDSFQEKINASKNQAKEYAGKIEEGCEEQLSHVATYVREHPFKSLLLAVGAGI
ncbi:MAG: hypothetical protein U1A05_02905, partial [Alphaproteobacteria bacterium]|nr:hypothetical protein [Alphaproteobacteria bacterium]